jgi:hypothetical protein
MAPSNTSSLAGPRDLAATLEAFAQRLRGLRKSKDRKLLDASLTKKQLRALTRRAREVMR